MSEEFLAFGGPKDGQWIAVEEGHSLIVARVTKILGRIGSDIGTLPGVTSDVEYQQGAYARERHPLEPCYVLRWKGWIE